MKWQHNYTGYGEFLSWRGVIAPLLCLIVILIPLLPYRTLALPLQVEDYIGVGAPAWSKDGERIAFDVFFKFRGQDYVDIYTIAADGSDIRRLTRLQDFNSAPTWSPDGKQIIYFNNTNGKADITIMDSNGGSPQKLTSGKQQNMQPSFSPDGKKIIFNSNRAGGDFEIYVMDADGKNVKRLTDTKVWNGDAVFSPDGTSIAFTSYRDNRRPNIYIMDADGKNVRRLTANGARNWSPSWTPDGKTIVYATDVDRDFNIYRMDAVDGGNPQALTTDRTDEGRGGVSVSPDGTKIAFSSNRSHNGFNDLYVMDMDGGNITRLTDLKNQVTK